MNHDDGEREYAYESMAETFAAEETILDQAERLGWTVVSISEYSSKVFTGS